MFVATYSTFVHANTPTTAQTQTKQKAQQNFELKEEHNKTLPKSYLSRSLPVDYIAKNQNFLQKLLLDQEESQGAKTVLANAQKFKETKEFQSAKSAYKEAAEKYSSFFHYTHTLDANKIINTELSNEFQELTKEAKRQVMVRTYEANEKYYRLTA